jgi:cation diffusion facilitator family transporter
VGSLPDKARINKKKAEHNPDSKDGASVKSALIANIIVTIAKFVCGLAGVQAMMSEAVHSLADSVNELVLLWGKNVGHRPPTKRHPLGGSRMRYFSGFIVALLLFGVGGLFTFIEAINKVSSITRGGPNAHIIDPTMLRVSILVSIISIAAEGWSLHNSYHEAKEVHARINPNQQFSAVRFWMDTKSSDLTSVLAEDTLAIAGLIVAIFGCSMSLFTGDEIWDAFASLIIGVILIIGAIALGKQNGSLLLGESANDTTYATIMKIIDDDPDVIAVLRPLITLHLSEKRVEAKMKLQFAEDVDIVTAINHLEDMIRSKFGNTYSIDLWIEPDRYDQQLADKIDQYVE